MKNATRIESKSSPLLPDGTEAQIPAAAAPSCECVEFTCIPMRDHRGTRFLLEHDGGAIVFVLETGTRRAIFSSGPLAIESIDPGLGAVAVDRIAAWLGLRLEATPCAKAVEKGRLSAEWVHLGRGRDGIGCEWEVYKLFVARGEHAAEFFLRIDASGTRAQLLEKWARYRDDLVTILEQVVHPNAPRVPVRHRATMPSDHGLRVLMFERGLEIGLPREWLVKAKKTFYRMTDSDETMGIEFSYGWLAPMKPGFPTVVERVEMARGRTDANATIHSGSRDGFEWAWFETRRDARDTKNRRAPKRPAVERVLIASNDSVQVVVTSVWWVDDHAEGEARWNEVIASLRLAGRVSAVGRVNAPVIYA